MVRSVETGDGSVGGMRWWQRLPAPVLRGRDSDRALALEVGVYVDQRWVSVAAHAIDAAGLTISSSMPFAPHSGCDVALKSEEVPCGTIWAYCVVADTRREETGTFHCKLKFIELRSDVGADGIELFLRDVCGHPGPSRSAFHGEGDDAVYDFRRARRYHGHMGIRVPSEADSVPDARALTPQPAPPGVGPSTDRRMRKRSATLRLDYAVSTCLGAGMIPGTLGVAARDGSFVGVHTEPPLPSDGTEVVLAVVVPHPGRPLVLRLAGSVIRATDEAGRPRFAARIVGDAPGTDHREWVEHLRELPG